MGIIIHVMAISNGCRWSNQKVYMKAAGHRTCPIKVDLVKDLSLLTLSNY